MSEHDLNTKHATRYNYEELEIKIAFLEDGFTKLSDEFYLQQRALDALKDKYNALLEKLANKGRDDDSTTEMADERPPHY